MSHAGAEHQRQPSKDSITSRKCTLSSSEVTEQRNPHLRQRHWFLKGGASRDLITMQMKLWSTWCHIRPLASKQSCCTGRQLITFCKVFNATFSIFPLIHTLLLLLDAHQIWWKQVNHWHKYGNSPHYAFYAASKYIKQGDSIREELMQHGKLVCS